DDPCLGYAFYSPPGAVARARRFPTGPVSAAAVLLTSLGVAPGHDADALSRHLIASVVGDLVRRGVRALEAFGHTAEVTELQDPRLVSPELRPVVEGLGDCSVDQCVLDADLLQDAGFVVVTHHRYFPRLRLHLVQGVGVEARFGAGGVGPGRRRSGRLGSACWKPRSYNSRSVRARSRAPDASLLGDMNRHGG